MEFLTNDKLLIVGAGGMIGSNMVQSALMLGLTPNICLYDIYEPGVHGVFDEIQQCAFPGVNVTYTVNPEEAFTGAKYIISSGGAPRKEGMTREDLLKGNCKIAAGDHSSSCRAIEAGNPSPPLPMVCHILTLVSIRTREDESRKMLPLHHLPQTCQSLIDFIHSRMILILYLSKFYPSASLTSPFTPYYIYKRGGL